MLDNHNVLAYWQHCARLQALAQILPQDLTGLAHKLSIAECEAGKIQDRATLAALLASGKTVVIAPCVASKHDDYFIPYYLLAEIDAEGVISAREALALPIVPNSVLENADLQPIVLGTSGQFEHHLVIHPPVWEDAPEYLNWQAQLAYAEQMLVAVTEQVWVTDLEELGFGFKGECLIFALNALLPEIVLDNSILKKTDRIHVIQAPRCSGKSTYARAMIEELWVEAAVKQAPPPRCVLLQYGVAPSYAKISAAVYLFNDHNLENLHNQLKQKFNIYYKGKQLLKNWQDASNLLENQYAEHGGVAQRKIELSANLDEVKAQHRWLQALYATWKCQVELIPTWTKALDFIASSKRMRLQRLYKFFALNLPAENVAGLNQDQMHEIIVDKIKRAENSKRIVEDAMFSLQNDLRHEQIVRGKLEEWQRQHHYDIASNKLWHEILDLAKKYWLVYFQQNAEYADFFSMVPTTIDLLIAEHAEYISPMTAASLLAKTKRAIIMGSYDALVNPNFSPQIDYVLARSYKLAECDSDFEDMQFDGIAGSVGNLWGLATANYREPDEVLSAQLKSPGEYILIDTRGCSQRYLGSRVNFAEINAIVKWLQQNHRTSLQIAVYTTFSGQRQCLQEALDEAGIANVKINLVQEPSFKVFDLLLFSPVYTAEDQGPYNFDCGTAMLDNMRANVSRQLVLIGDSRIFKPHLHSAAGNFAKLFERNIKHSKNTQEVANV